jgi:hypothetical protein
VAYRPDGARPESHQEPDRRSVSLFTYGTRESFIGVWHPSTHFGTVHVASTSELPTSKVWSWGFDEAAHRWRQSLSDDNSAYIELQAGLFRNQETYGMLEPQEQVRFSEYWIPARDLGGITRATADAVLNVSARERGLGVELNADAGLSRRASACQGRARPVRRGGHLTPRVTWRADIDAPSRPNGWTSEGCCERMAQSSCRTTLAGTTRCHRRTWRRVHVAPCAFLQATTGRRLTTSRRDTTRS